MGVVGVDIPSELSTPLQSHNRPCYQHAGRCAMQKGTSIREHGHYLSVLGS